MDSGLQLLVPYAMVSQCFGMPPRKHRDSATTLKADYRKDHHIFWSNKYQPWRTKPNMGFSKSPGIKSG